MNNQHIVKAVYLNKGTVVYLFYEIKSRLYSGHFFLNPIKKVSTLKTIEDTFPPTFDDIGDYIIKLKEEGIKIEFTYLKPDGGSANEYEFFKSLKAII